ncbi:MAG: 30S ribosomal protein S9 [Candidatus Falkowbacteria bacterium]
MPEETKEKFTGKYITAIGRRKTSAAQIRLYKNGKGVIIVNDKDVKDYFPSKESINLIMQPLKLAGADKELGFSILVKGGGKVGQAEAIRHGITRALLIINKEAKPALKASGLTTRDARKKERKKPGLKKARRAPQWSKR